MPPSRDGKAERLILAQMKGEARVVDITNPFSGLNVADDRHPPLGGWTPIFVLRERVENWNENATTVRLGGDWVVILEQRPTRADILVGLAVRGASRTSAAMVRRGPGWAPLPSLTD